MNVVGKWGLVVLQSGKSARLVRIIHTAARSERTICHARASFGGIFLTGWFGLKIIRTHGTFTATHFSPGTSLKSLALEVRTVNSRWTAWDASQRS